MRLSSTASRSDGRVRRRAAGYHVCAGARPARIAAARVVNTAAPAAKAADEVSVRFNVPLRTQFGQVVKAVGGAPQLGAWDAKAAPTLHWTNGDVWRGEILLAPGHYEFKIVVFESTEATAEWESCSNRVLQVPAFPGTLEVSCNWCQTGTKTTFIDAPPTTEPDLIEEAAAQAAAQRSAERESQPPYNGSSPSAALPEALAAGLSGKPVAAAAVIEASSAAGEQGAASSPATVPTEGEDKPPLPVTSRRDDEQPDALVPRSTPGSSKYVSGAGGGGGGGAVTSAVTAAAAGSRASSPSPMTSLCDDIAAAVAELPRTSAVAAADLDAVTAKLPSTETRAASGQESSEAADAAPAAATPPKAANPLGDLADPAKLMNGLFGWMNKR